MLKSLKDLFRRNFPDRVLAEQLNDQGTDFAVSGKFQEARKAFEKALQANPKLPEAWANLGLCALTAGDPKLACDFFNKAITLNPDQAETFDNWGNALARLGLFIEAAEKHKKALALQPELSSAKAHLGNTLLVMGRVEDAQALVQRAWGESPSDPVIASLALSAALYSTSLTPEQVFAGHRRWPGAEVSPPARSISNPDPQRRLKIGYLSGDFRRHSCACFLLPLLRAHDRTQVEVFAYSNTANADEITERFHDVVDRWRDVTQLSDSRLANKVEADEIDILVDCSGHTDGNRLEVFGLRPAPLQVTWLGYPNTTGLAALDLRMTDAVADPVGVSDKLHTERLLRLSSGYHTYTPLVPTPDPDVKSQGECVHFGVFHNLAKYSETSIALWAKVASAVPGSKLVLKSKGLEEAALKAEIVKRFQDKGLTENQIVVLGWQSEYGRQFEDLLRVDVALDATPYNGTTTTCEALWMGVPVVTLLGDRTAGRVGASLLTQIGRSEWIADTEQKFVQIAADLAHEVLPRKELRHILRQSVSDSSLGNASKFAHSLESAYRLEWHAVCSRQN